MINNSCNLSCVSVSSKSKKLAYASIEDSDQPAHQRRLIRVFDGRFKGNQRSNVSSGGKLKLLAGCVDVQTDLNPYCTQMPTYIY